MKIRALSAILAIALVLSMTACGNSPASSAAAPASSADASSNAASEAAKPTASSEDWKPFDAEGKPLRTDRDANGKTGVIAAANYNAAKAGLEILKKGGNAVDAAVATGFALGVCEPNASGLGGGGFMMIHSAKDGSTKFIDFREIAPAAATTELWKKDAEGKVIGGQSSEGGKSVGVPGEVSGLLYALENYGTMDRAQVMQPAIDYANNGFEISPVFAGMINDNFAFMQKYPELGHYYLKNGLPYATGDHFSNPDLAKTLGMIAKDGRDAFYKGDVAEKFVETVNKYGGVMTMEDLAKYEPKVRDVIVGNYRGYEIIAPPPPSSGGAHLIQILNVLENYDIASMEVNSAEYLHLFSEAFKMAFADRSKYMADTDFTDVPVSGLVSKEYAKALADSIDLTKSQKYSAGDPYKYQSGSTTHFSVADKDGNIVAVTKTINYFFGSKVAIPGYGFIANDEMDDFSSNPESVNCIEPGKKPLSSMTPTIILKDGKPVATIGSPGGTRIFPTLAQVISRIIDHKMDIQEAIDAGRIYDDAKSTLCYETGENGIDPKVVEELKALGHEMVEKGEWDLYFGGVQGIVYLEDGSLRGGADPRRDGKAVGF